MSQDFFCFSCHKELKVLEPVGRREECPHCRADVHVCKNCQHYDPKAYNECREPQADVVKERDRANYCDFFTPKKGAHSQQTEKDRLRAAAEALFKKG